MESTFYIRLNAVMDNLVSDGDRPRFNREMSRLEIDLMSAIRRCESSGDDPCNELHTLLDFVDNKLRGDASLDVLDKGVHNESNNLRNENYNR